MFGNQRTPKPQQNGAADVISVGAKIQGVMNKLNILSNVQPISQLKHIVPQFTPTPNLPENPSAQVSGRGSGLV